jgi:hypothetical protein
MKLYGGVAVQLLMILTLEPGDKYSASHSRERSQPERSGKEKNPYPSWVLYIP